MFADLLKSYRHLFVKETIIGKLKFDDDGAHLLEVVVQESIEDWVCAAGGDPDQVKHQVDLCLFFLYFYLYHPTPIHIFPFSSL